MAFSRHAHFKSWFLGSSWSNVPDLPYLSQEVPLTSCFGRDLRWDMPEATEPNLVYPKEQWCLSLVTGAMANKADWSCPSSLPGPVWRNYKGKFWILVSNLIAVPNGKRVSTHSGQRPRIQFSFQPQSSHPHTWWSHIHWKSLCKNTSSSMVLAALLFIDRIDHIQVDTTTWASLQGSEVGIRHQVHSKVLMVVIFHPLL